MSRTRNPKPRTLTCSQWLRRLHAATLLVMLPVRLSLTALLLSACSCACALRAQVPELIEQHCSECHAGTDAERDFDIEKLFAPRAVADAEFVDELALAVQRVRGRTMPPPDEESLPSDEQRRAIAVELAKLAPKVPGARIATMRRLTRAQYERTVRDLFDIKWRAQNLLPGDASAHGFDGIGDVQNVSPLMFEKYLDAAGAVATTVLTRPAAVAAVFGDDEPLSDRLPMLLRRAFRRPLLDGEVEERIADFATLRERGASLAEARHALLRGVLASPAFLFRSETGQQGAPWLLNAHELAVRLAYMLTSSMPDQQLQKCADDGSLLQSDVLASQARRLASSRDGHGLAQGFAAQWLALNEVLTATADFRRYPGIWNRRLRPSMRAQAVHLFAYVVRADRRVLELLDADYTFVDRVLAKHYGLPQIKGRGFHKVALADRRRGGLLGTGAMLMASSYPLRTSPVKRGQWILTRLLDSPPPPPPADAGTLPADDKQADGLTLRKRLERHRREKRCASCHAEMDALGFALENYDVLGLWRDDIHGVAVDAQAELPDGTALDGPVALKDALLRRGDDFVRTLARKLLVHGVGRDMLLTDEPAIADIVTRTRAGDDRFSVLLEAVVTSPLFTMHDPDHQP